MRDAPKLIRRGDAAPVVIIDSPNRGAEKVIFESEPNQTRAAKIDLPVQIRGTMATEKDVDVFTVKPPREGMLSVSLTRVADADLQVAAFLAEKERFLADRGPKDTSEALPNIPVRAGKAVRISVSEFLSKRELLLRKRRKSQPRGTASQEYRLSIAMVNPESGDELEPNDESGAASPLTIGKRGTGYLGWAKDIDWWVMDCASDALKGGVDALVDIDIRASSVVGKLSLKVVDKKGKGIVSRTGGQGQDLFIRALSLPVTGGLCYLRVSGSRTLGDVPYYISATSRLRSKDSEAEPNDETAQANPLRSDSSQVDGQVFGHIVPGDRDIFILPALSQAGLRLALTYEPSIAVKGSLTLILGKQPPLVVTGEHSGSVIQRRGIALPPGQQILVIVGGLFSGITPQPYQLRWSLVPELPGLRSSSQVTKSQAP